LDELAKDDFVVHITSLKHVDHNVEDTCVNDEPIFLDELFKDECFEKTCVKGLKSKFFREKRNLI